MSKSSTLKPEGISEFSRGYRNLPHIELPGSWYFLPSKTNRNSVLSDAERDFILRAIRFHDGKKYDLDIAVVMPDHIHLILHPLPKTAEAYYSLAEILHSIKSYTAHTLKKHLWQDENYDHLIRNERDYIEKLEYILYNPVEAGLAETARDYRWLYYKGWQQ